MAKDWYFIWGLLAEGVAAAKEELSDFSNDLATDIGPLLALFGETMTKQYLSESTTWLDYFIFAMGPIGIITAVVSAIRVCGSSPLRAFIGRAQEGEALVEAELCTSTSRDVCELFNNGGITRVLGRPNILELIYTPSFTQDRPSVHLFRSYLRSVFVERDALLTGWHAVDHPSRINMVSPRVDISDQFITTKPNLSLNVGIKRRSLWVFRTIGIVGFILQVGVITLAGIGVWVLGWNLDSTEDENPAATSTSASASSNYAPGMYIAGTVILCAGMWACAALVGQSTKEFRYRRHRSRPANHQSRLIWLQPGQVVGDQHFDPCAYLEDRQNSPIDEWTSSIKEMHQRPFQTHTWVAVVAVLGGYIVQFIGLRGLRAWVSIAQLGITVVMSLLRGILRVQRLSREDNKLAHIPDAVLGHELEWLAFELTSKYVASQSCGPSAPRLTVSLVDRSNAIGHPQKKAFNDDCGQLLKIRTDLARLTGLPGAVQLGIDEYQEWPNHAVKVRKKAHEVSSAVEGLLDVLFLRTLDRERTARDKLDIGVLMSLASNARAELVQHEARLTVRSPNGLRGAYTLDSAEVEAVLGLWLWSLVADEQVAPPWDGSRHLRVSASDPRVFRILCAQPCDGSPLTALDEDVLGNMELWFGLEKDQFSRHDIAFSGRKDDACSLSALWKKHQPIRGRGLLEPEQPNEDLRRTLPYHLDAEPRSPSSRFCGLAGVRDALEKRRKPSDVGKELPRLRLSGVNIPVIETPLLDLCAQELFVFIMVTLLKQSKFGDEELEVRMIAESGRVRFDNEIVNHLLDAFVNAGLGQRHQALQCIVPPLWDKLAIRDADELVEKSITSARAYRDNAEHVKAETVLNWTERIFRPHNHTPTLAQLWYRIIRELLELHRRRISSNRDKPTRRWIDWFPGRDPNLKKAIHGHDFASLMVSGYNGVMTRLYSRTPGRFPVADAALGLRKATEAGDWVDSLYNLCFITGPEVDLNDSNLRASLCNAVKQDACRSPPDMAPENVSYHDASQLQDWEGVVDILLQMGVDPNLSRACEDGRLALSFARMEGVNSNPAAGRYSNCAILLIQYGPTSVCPSAPPHIQALVEAYVWYARNPAEGHLVVAALLCPTENRINRESARGFTPIWIALKRGLLRAFTQLLMDGTPDLEARLPDDRRSLLHYAIQAGHRDAFALLLEKGIDANARDNTGRTALHIAAEDKDMNGMKLLIAHGADLDAKTHSGLTPLLVAAHTGLRRRRLGVVEYLARAGANLDAKDEHGRSALSMLAEYNGSDEVVETMKLLLELGASIDELDKNGRTPLSWAVGLKYGSVEAREVVVDCLIRGGAQVDSATPDKAELPETKMTPLAYAAQNGRHHAVGILLEAGADINVTTSNGRTPLELALAEMEALEVAESQEADPWAQDDFDFEEDEGPMLVVERLLLSGARMSVLEHTGTLIHRAAKYGAEHALKAFIEAGASVDAPDRSGKSPLLIAARAGHLRCVKMLLDHGANSETGLSDLPADERTQLLQKVNAT